ncbi:hypothetical protein F5Y18DRAFT_308354 [Xylariaceae sp. FL1019]|nr:hypothetical protein F5Y18DRAFT_308354 [Xylariaceae sp. FL1019]
MSNSRSIGGKALAPDVGPPPKSTEHTTFDIHGPRFDHLYAQKRSDDPVSVKRRESLSDQRPRGYIATMMQKIVSGPGGPNPLVGSASN